MAINAIIEINISYKISINYCSIKTQFLIILSKDLNTTLLFFCKLFKITKFVLHILLMKATLKSKVAPTNHNSLAFLLHTRKTCSNVEFFSVFFTNFFGSNYQNKSRRGLVGSVLAY